MLENKPLYNIFDSHAHYDSDCFDDRFELIESMRNDGIRGITNIGCDVESSLFSKQLADKYDFMWYTAGIHPENANAVNKNTLLELRSTIGKKCVAIGEIGLDYHYDGYDREKQIKLFEEQMILAKSLDLPVVIHSRDACEDTMAVLQKHRLNGVMHCFSGSAQTAKEVVNLGMYVGFTGVITFKNAKKAKKAAEVVPLDKLLIETDCPYMAPEPHRGTRNFSGNLIYTAKALAEIKGVSYEEIVRITAENAERLYRISST